MFRRVTLVIADISEKRSPSIIRVKRIAELRKTLALTSARRLILTANVATISPILVTLIMEDIRFSEISVLTRATRRNIPEDDIIQHL
jgi:hypothetical protein